MSSPRVSYPVRRPSLGLTLLESREVPANIVLQAGGILAITGDAGNDSVRIAYATTSQTVSGIHREVADTTKIDVAMAGDNGNAMNKQFNAADVTKITFAGKGGTDIFTNSTSKVATTSTINGGTIGSNVLPGNPNNANLYDKNSVGVFTVGSTGAVQVDYLFAGCGYQGQLGFYSLAGMENYTAGSTEYIKEAARRVLSNTNDGRMVINRYAASDRPRFSAYLSWEGAPNTTGTYRGPQSFQFAAGDKLGVMLIPNGRFQDAYASPSSSGTGRPLFSIPSANPYGITPQMLGQMADFSGMGSIFALEDIRLDDGSDRDYNDMVFQVLGARSTAINAVDVINPQRNFTASAVAADLFQYATPRVVGDASVTGAFQSGKYLVDSTGKLGVDYLYDGGGFIGQVGMFSLQGMGQYDPQSPQFIKEAIRRALSNTVMGHTVIDDYTDGAKTSASDAVLKGFNAGTYRGIRSFTMTPGDTVGFVFIPNGTLWEVFSNPNLGEAKRALFSLSEANPNSANGRNQLADAGGSGNILAFEDVRQDGTSKFTSDRDFNDVVFRLYGASLAGVKPKLTELAAKGKNWSESTVGKVVRNETWENWS